MAKYRFNVRDFTKRACEAYFGMKLGDQDKSWAPDKVCKHCTEMLRFWTQGKVSLMLFGVPMVWHEPQNRHDDCYFCIVDMCGWNQQKKKDWYYSGIKSARRPIPHYAKVPKQYVKALDKDGDCFNYSISPNPFLVSAWKNLKQVFFVGPKFAN